MDLVFFFLVIASLVLVWRWLAKRLHSEPWIIRHIAGATAGFVAMLFVFGLGSSLGFYELEQKNSVKAPTETSIEKADELLAASSSPASLSTFTSAPSTTINTPPATAYSTVDAVFQEFKPRLTDLVEKGMAMEPYRQSSERSDIQQCGDMMRANKTALEKLRSDLSSAFSALPAELRFNPEFEPIHNGTANLIRCVTCVPAAMADCLAAAKALGVQYGSH